MEKRNLVNGYYLLEQDLKEILAFVEPTKANFETYSHRLYGLYVRACMEFEASCKLILMNHDYEMPKRPGLNTYYDIHNYEEFKQVNDCIIKIQMSEEITLIPLQSWDKKAGVNWYNEYHKVKHSRVTDFSKASLINVLNAVAAVYVLLYARYGISALTQHQENSSWETDDDGFVYKDSSLFKVKHLKQNS